MKKLFLISLLVCVGILQSLAFDYTDERGVTWSCSETDWNEETQSYTSAIINSATGYGDEVVIPEKVYDGTKEYTVTSIGFTFQDNKTLEKVTWPSTVTMILYNMFKNCSSLKAVENTRNVTFIYDCAFENCNNLIELDLGSCMIADLAFYGCSKLQSIGESAKCTYVGSQAFSQCSSLQSIGNPKFTSIPDNAFNGCSNLENIDLSLCTSVGSSAFSGCSKLQNVNTSICTYIGNGAFYGCSSITEVDLSACKSLGNNAFWGSRISKVSLPAALKSMGYQCFDNVKEYTFNGTQPAALTEQLSSESYNNYPAFDGSSYIIRVPESAVDAYKAADIWKNYADKIFSISDQLDYDVTTTAMDSQSGLEQAIGATNMKKVVSLKATGTINGYDIFMIRTKMTNLQNLDLTDADIVANGFAYYEGYSTEDNVVGGYSFYKLNNLVTLKLPKNAITIGSYAVANCSSLESVDFPKKLKYLNDQSFGWCGKLDNVILPDGLESIGNGDCSYSFTSCKNLKTIQFPPSLKYIGGYAFCDCSSLEKISLPGLDRIDQDAFYCCSSLKEVRIPSTLQNVGNGAFGGCSNLADIYTYTVEPISIGQNTFDETAYKSARLWMPTQSYANYYYQTQWGQFDNDNYRWFDEPYKYMYINKDYTLSDANSASGDKGRFDGNPDIDVNPGGGLIVDGDKDQTADDIHLKADASNWATIIAKANVDAKRIFIDITIAANRWHFFCFPFDIKRSNIKCDGNFVFRYYDGKVRAEKGKGGWTDLPATEEYLKAGKGYIFQASASCTLSIMIEKEKFGKLPNVKFDCNLEANASTNEQDASWNFVGNPFTSFFDLNDMGYNAPVTRWNGSGYEAVRPGDDDYIFHPYEAFFVQRPTGSSNIEFDPEHRMTQIGSNNRKTENAKKAMKRQLNPERLLVNLAISDGKNTDKTRVVFNQAKSNKYEMDCDAAKFESSTSAVQLYSIEAQGGKMAINERPQGSVQLGFTAKADGDYTISAERMDQPVLLKDNLMNITYDLSNGDYSFSSEAGTFDNRFMLLIDGGATGIADIAKEAGVNIMPSTNGINLTGVDGKTVNVYSLSGALFATRTENGFLNLSKGVYIVEVGKMKAKVMVK
ncbi:leucine-rich repeat domain-containing protein [uncultured Prevotella sp.]|uniref:leucine-rich repeat domain-containing protein n=1 Tax=uncultured Prevotella sp. TaxID=159272 RepID=UPI0026260515|nr:leucine-rich repeat domain-containing protein [uncultured Prevotella sp.]